MSLFIKVCGITRPEDAELACREGATAIGLNFWRGSKRFVEDGRAREVVAAVPSGALKVGVFVNPSRAEVESRLAGLGLDLVQLHGDEQPEEWADFPAEQLIRAVRVEAPASLAQDRAWRPRFFLYDAASDGYGGSGKQAPWEVVAALGSRPFILAGGLTPENVAAAIAAVHPEGVDVASGVEASPGIKNPVKVAAFIANARSASRA
jgi:phosphoribosylanthranilate isomerase